MAPWPELKIWPYVIQVGSSSLPNMTAVPHSKAVPSIIVAGGKRVGTSCIEINAKAGEVAAPPRLRQVLVSVSGVLDHLHDGPPCVMLEEPLRQRGPTIDVGGFEGAIAHHEVVIQVTSRGVGYAARRKNGLDLGPARTRVILQASNVQHTASHDDGLLADLAARRHVTCHGVVVMGMQVSIVGALHPNSHLVAEGGIGRIHLEDSLDENVRRRHRKIGTGGEVQHPLNVEAIG
mmetsp:Transcript_17235/g.50025  ORF Transcript_17235/g.50025 Transcript_17235/m.50025 type:complete len:234 (+) Transcript_17235:2167-2868(+)